MLRVGDPRAARAHCTTARARGAVVGLVPTMGALHAGHLALIERARRDTHLVVVSIFVNPLQFGPTEDLSRYPRDLERDAARCEDAGVDVLFAPSAAAMYPDGHQTVVEVSQLSRGLCGDRRPGHFRGVATVVAKLFALVGPCVAVFGEKDYQQLLVIRQMVGDLMFDVQVVGVPIVREPDGLAMSSRNAYLTPSERASACALYRSLCRAKQCLDGTDAVAADEMLAVARGVVDREPALTLEYLECRHVESLQPLARARPAEGVLLVAAHLGRTRLIDNLRL